MPPCRRVKIRRPGRKYVPCLGHLNAEREPPLRSRSTFCACASTCEQLLRLVPLGVKHPIELQHERVRRRRLAHPARSRSPRFALASFFHHTIPSCTRIPSSASPRGRALSALSYTFSSPCQFSSLVYRVDQRRPSRAERAGSICSASRMVSTSMPPAHPLAVQSASGRAAHPLLLRRRRLDALLEQRREVGAPIGRAQQPLEVQRGLAIARLHLQRLPQLALHLRRARLVLPVDLADREVQVLNVWPVVESLITDDCGKFFEAVIIRRALT